MGIMTQKGDSMVIAERLLRERELQRVAEVKEREGARARELEEVATFAVDRVETLEKELAAAGLRNVLLAREIGRLREAGATEGGAPEIRRSRRLPTLLLGVALGVGGFWAWPMVLPYARTAVSPIRTWYSGAATPKVAAPVVAPTKPVELPKAVTTTEKAPSLRVSPIVTIPHAPEPMRQHHNPHKGPVSRRHKRSSLERSVADCGNDPLCGLNH